MLAYLNSDCWAPHPEFLIQYIQFVFLGISQVTLMLHVHTLRIIGDTLWEIRSREIIFNFLYFSIYCSKFLFSMLNYNLCVETLNTLRQSYTHTISIHCVFFETAILKLLFKKKLDTIYPYSLSLYIFVFSNTIIKGCSENKFIYLQYLSEKCLFLIPCLNN